MSGMTYPHPMLLADFYKLSHREQYPPGTEYVYSTWIPRRSHIAGVDKVVAFGFQRFILGVLIDYFDEYFFDRPIREVVSEYERVVRATLGKTDVDVGHIKALHRLGYLPLRIKAVPEGTLVPLRVPMLTIENTLPDFFWLTNYIETLFSCEVWGPSTSATIANEYRRIFDKWAAATNPEGASFTMFQGHDFSMRGMSSIDSAITSGLGHLLSFVGTDTIPAILGAEMFYEADVESELIGTSVPASEHSVMCCGGPEGEYEIFRRIIQDVYPNGIVSVVSDAYDLWHVVTETLGRDLHDVIMARDGKVVVRPDSGDPVDILCGTYQPHHGDFERRSLPEEKGVVELLWEAFGGTVSSTGYKILDPHIGVIYGDSITPQRAEAICRRLEAKGFASTNVVLGIGSFTYQYNTRDTFGFAMKATWVKINGKEKAIFKDPVTDDGTKKSLTGRVAVLRADNGGLFAMDGLTRAAEDSLDGDNLLTDLFVDGKLVRKVTFSEVRRCLDDQRSTVVHSPDSGGA